MRTFRSLVYVVVLGTCFLLALGVLDLVRIDERGAFVWDPRIDTAGLGRLSRRAWQQTADAIHDALADDEPAQPQPPAASPPPASHPTRRPVVAR